MAIQDWKAFQDLVARIEGIAAPRGAIVRSPDFVRDLNTGTDREVDASIRYRVGTADILVTVEARRRRGAQDVMWIEQLATKRRSIGAATTIAVASDGFTPAAIKLATHESLVLRQISEIRREDIQRLFAEVHHIESLPTVLLWDYSLYGFDAVHGDHTPLTRRADDEVARNGVNAAVFRWGHSGVATTLNHVIASVRGNGGPDDPLFNGVPEDGRPIERTITLSVDSGTLELETVQGWKNVSQLRLRMALRRLRSIVPPSLAVAYTAPEGTEHAAHNQFEMHGTLSNEAPLRITFQRGPEGSLDSLDVEVADHAGNQFRPAHLELIRRYRRKPDGTEEPLDEQTDSKLRYMWRERSDSES